MRSATSVVTCGDHIDKHNLPFRWMAVFSVIYISAAVLFYGLGLGDTSLVYANIINLTIRIIYSVHFITSYFAGHGTRYVLRWIDAVPPWQMLLVAGSSTILVRSNEKKSGVLGIIQAGGRMALLDTRVMTHVALGGWLTLMCLGTWWVFSGKYLSIPGVVKESREK